MGEVKMLDFSKVFNQAVVKEKALTRPKAELKKAEDKVTLNSNKQLAWQDVKGHIEKAATVAAKLGSDIQGTRGRGGSKYNNAWQQNQAQNITNDLGSANDYIIAETTFEATRGQIDVSVNKIAKQASFTSKWFDSNYQLTADQEVVIHLTNSAGTELDVPVNLTNGDNLAAIIGKLNSKLGLHKVKVELMNDAIGNKSAFVFRNLEAGVGEILCDTGLGDGNFFGELGTDAYYIDGENAEITINGALVTSNSNTLKNILPGVNLSLIRENNTGRSQIIRIEENVGSLDKTITEFIDAYNILLEDIAVQTAREEAGASRGKPKGTAYLADSNSFLSIKNAIEELSGSVPGLDGVVKSLQDIGFELLTVPATKEKPQMQQLVLKNSALYQVAMSTNFEGLRKLFQTEVNVVADPANEGLTIGKARQTELLSPAVLGREVKLRIDVINSVPTVTFSLDNGTTWKNAEYNGAYISFNETELKGLQLPLGLNGVVNHQDNFTIKVTEGIADKFELLSNNWVNRESNGIIDREIMQSIDELTKDIEQQEKAEKILEAKQAKLEGIFSMIETMSMRAEITLGFLSEM